MLCRIQHPYSGVVVHTEEAIGAIFCLQHAGRYVLGIVAVITFKYQVIVGVHTRLQQCVFITIKAVLTYQCIATHTIKGNAFAPSLNKVCYGVEGTHIIVYHHQAGINARANAVVKHQCDTFIDKRLKMVIPRRALCLRHDDAAHLMGFKHLAHLHLALIAFLAHRYHDAVTTF